MADAELKRHKCVTLCVENGDRVPLLNLCRNQLTTSAISIEVQRNCCTVNILDLYLQTKECSEIHNLA
jgi:hypothetical protein